MVEKRPFTTRNPLASRAAHGDPHLPRTWERSRCAVPTTVNEHGLWIFQPRCRQALRAHNAVGMYLDPDGIASSSSIVPVDCITICQRQVALLSSGWHRQATSLLVLHTASGVLYRHDLARQPSCAIVRQRQQQQSLQIPIMFWHPTQVSVPPQVELRLVEVSPYSKVQSTNPRQMKPLHCS